MKYNLPIKDDTWFANIKWDNSCLECHTNHGGVCHNRSCAEDNYDPWGDIIPADLYHMDGNNVQKYIEEKAIKMGIKPTIDDNVNLQELLVYNYINDKGALTGKQLGNSFSKWKNLVFGLYKVAVSIISSEEWFNINIIQEHSQRDELYEKMDNIYKFIGDVNGYPLHKDYEFEQLIYSYVNRKIENFEHHIPTGAGRDEIFRYRIERFLARKILLQKLTPEKILIDEANEKRWLRKMKRSRKRTMERVKNKKVAKESKEPTAEQLKEYNIEFGTFTVISNAFKCNKNHNIEQIRASIEILTSGGSIIKESFSAGYCNDCKVFFILEKDFKNMKSKGVLLCQLVTETEYISTINNNKFNLKAESLLHRCGYNVNASDELTTIQRQDILARVIDNNMYSISGLLSFLDWLIDRANKTLNKNMSSAIKKWEADRCFVENYGSESQEKVPVNIIKHKKYESHI